MSKSNKRREEENKLLKKGGGLKHAQEHLMQNKSKPNQNKSNNQNIGKPNSPDFPATAPYNFISFSDKIFDPTNIPVSKRYSGVINYDIQTDSPLFIRDTLTLEEKKKVDNKDSRWVNKDFYQPGNIQRIPGSSFRGALRTLFEIISCSEMTMIEKNRKYHFRSFADKSLDLRSHYSKRMMKGNINKNNDPAKVFVKGGYIFSIKNNYYIKPSEHNGRVYRFVKNEKWNNLNNNNSFQVFPVTFTKSENEVTDSHQNSDRNVRYMSFFEASDVKKIDQAQAKGFAICPETVKSRHAFWVIPMDDQANYNVKTIKTEVISNYENDNSKKYNLFEIKEDCTNRKVRKEITYKLKPDDKVNSVFATPCFYAENDNGEIFSIGHTGLFRIAYHNSIGDLFNQSGIIGSDSQKIVDLTKSVFGYTDDKNNQSKGKLFVEDSYRKTDELPTSDDQFGILEILSSPRPTTFQHYLKQEKSKIKRDINLNYSGLFHFDTPGAKLRGYKSYWHHDQPDYIPTKLNINDNNQELSRLIDELKNYPTLLYKEGTRKENWILNTKELKEKHPTIYQDNLDLIIRHNSQNTVANPVPGKVSFSGSIKFENLTEIEMGCLVKTMQVMKSGFKIGMGKPLGLGSVKLSRMDVWLDLEPGIVYSKLEGQTLKSLSEPELNTYSDMFESKIKNQIDNYETIMKQVNAIYSLENKKGSDSIKYMKLDDFKKRQILPDILDV